MAKRGTWRARLARRQAQAAQTGQVIVKTPVLIRWAQAATWFMLAAVLAGARLFDGCAPFGLALVGAAGSGLNAGMALLGAGFGYLSLMGLVDALRYVSACILTFSVAFAFYDVPLYKRPWTMPVAAAAMNACTGFIYRSRQGWRAQDVIWFITEVILTAAAAYAFRFALADRSDRGERSGRPGTLLLAAAVLICLARLQPVRGISLGGVLTAAAVLLCAWQTGATTAAAVGVGFGLAVDLAGGGQMMHAVTFAAAGLASGLARSRRRLRPAAVFSAVCLAVPLWRWEGGSALAPLYEGMAGAAIFLLVPAPFLRGIGAYLSPPRPKQTDERVAGYVRERLEGAAASFRALCDALRPAFQRAPRQRNDDAVIFDRAADRVCRTCALRGTCWERDYVTTFNALNDATRAMVDRGRGETGDFPSYFSSRCIRFPAFLTAVNEELTALLCRRQYDNRIRDSRRALCAQYGHLSDILGAAAMELGQELTPDPARERRVRQHLAVLGVEGDASVYYDGDHRLRVQLDGAAARRLDSEEETAAVAELLGAPLSRQRESGGRLLLVQKEPYMVVAGAAARRKDGETVSGDAGAWFKRPDGKLYVLLCDGMGCGTAAHRESGLAVRLLEQFLRAGVETVKALTILNSALALRGEDEGGFTTVDLLELDLFTGEGRICKFGAAPTYLKQRGAIRRITGTTLPAGISEQGEDRPDCASVRLEAGDCVLMVSDGVCGTGEDDWLQAKLSAFDGTSPRELAREVIDADPEGGSDDRTALVICLARREK